MNFECHAITIPMKKFSCFQALTYQNIENKLYGAQTGQNKKQNPHICRFPVKRISLLIYNRTVGRYFENVTLLLSVRSFPPPI